MFEDRGFDWRESFEIVRRRWAIPVVAMLVLGAAAFTVVRIREPDPLYRASSTVLLELRANESPFNSSGGIEDPRRAMPTEIARLNGDAVREKVVDELGIAPAVNASQVGDTDMFSITAVGADANEAAVVANTYAEAYVEHRHDLLVDAFERGRSALEDRIGDLDQQLAMAALALSGGELGEAEAELTRQEQAGLLEQRVQLAQRLSEYDVDIMAETGGARVFREASPPAAPFNRSNPERAAALGVIVGAVLGLAAIVAREYFRDAIHTERQIHALVGLPVLGIVPAGSDELLALGREGKESSRVADAFRDLRSALLSQAPDGLDLVEVTSPSDGDDVAAATANIAIAFARAGRQVLTISTDFRQSTLLEILEVDSGPGLSNVLLDSNSAEALAQPVPHTPQLTVLPPGPLPPGIDASDLLAMREADDLIAELKSHHDLVVVDSPPVLQSSVAATIAARASVVLVVVSAGATRRGELREAVELLERAGAPPMGVLLHQGRPRQDSRGGEAPIRELPPSEPAEPRPVAAGGGTRTATG